MINNLYLSIKVINYRHIRNKFLSILFSFKYSNIAKNYPSFLE